jgi:hypothetical protein
MENEDKDLGKSGYLDLLIATLDEHEKNLYMLIKKSEKLSRRTNKLFENFKELLKDYPKLGEKEKGVNPVSGGGDTLIYLKIKLDRPIDEVIKILETLKKE